MLVCYRQAVGATIAVWNNVTEEVWMFMKEISSGGDVSTVRKLSEKYLLQDYKYAQSIKINIIAIGRPAMISVYTFCAMGAINVLH